MCVLFLAIDRHPRWRVVLAANRDESYGRATAPASRWEDCPRVIGGRDLEAGGTWFGVTDAGRWAAITNVRDLPAHRDGARSRGDLPTGFLCGSAPPVTYAHEAFRQRQAYNPFNLLTASGADVWYASTHRAAPERVPAGVHGLSNATLDVPWPKVERGKQALSALLDTPDLAPGPLFDLLADAEPAPEADLPQTGVGPDVERTLSSIYIASPGYGTRASMVLLLNASGEGVFVERTTAPEASGAEKRFTLRPGSTGGAP